MDLQVIDNFLGDYQFKSLQTIMMGDEFPWYYNSYIISGVGEDGRYQFIHTFLNFQKGPSHFYHLMSPFERLGKMFRIKSNMIMKTLLPRRSLYHIDEVPGATRTAIYYINTCNGYTEFEKDHTQVRSVANRLIVFDSSDRHMGTTCTDKNVRVVLNVNYLESYENGKPHKLKSAVSYKNNINF